MFQSAEKLIKNSHIKWLCLFLFAAVIFFNNLNDPGIYSTQEGNAAIIARNMIDSGDYLSAYIKDAHNTEKPIFCYWLCVISSLVFGMSEFALRFPSALAAVLTVMLTAWFAKRLYNENIGICSGIILSTMLTFVNLGRVARIDIVLCLFFLVSMILLYKGYIENNKPRGAYIYMFYIVLGISTLVKGPVSVVLAALIIIAYAVKKKNLKIFWELKPVSGFFIGVLISCPWYIYESMRTQGDFAFDFFWNQNINRFLGINTEYCEGQRKSTLFYIPNLLYGALPWSLFLLPALYSLIGTKLKDWRNWRIFRLSDNSSFLLFWVLAVFCFFSLSCIKRTDYILPLYPALAVLLARYISYLHNNGYKLHNLIKNLWLLVSLFIFVVFIMFCTGGLKKLAAMAVDGHVPHVGIGDATFVISVCNQLAPYTIYVGLAVAFIILVLYFSGRMLEKGRINILFAGMSAFLFVLYFVYFAWLQPVFDTNRSVRAFGLEAANFIGTKESVAYYKVWNLELVFYVNRNYDKVWSDKDIIDYASGKMKYNYYICPADVYEVEDKRLRERVEVIARTHEGHEEPLVLCAVKKSAEHAAADKTK